MHTMHWKWNFLVDCLYIELCYVFTCPNNVSAMHMYFSFRLCLAFRILLEVEQEHIFHLILFAIFSLLSFSFFSHSASQHATLCHTHLWEIVLSSIFRFQFFKVQVQLMIQFALREFEADMPEMGFATADECGDRNWASNFNWSVNNETRK